VYGLTSPSTDKSLKASQTYSSFEQTPNAQYGGGADTVMTLSWCVFVSGWVLLA